MSTETPISPALPDLNPSQETVDFLSNILLGGGAKDHTFTNGRSLKISAMLATRKGGFFDAAYRLDDQPAA